MRTLCILSPFTDTVLINIFVSLKYTGMNTEAIGAPFYRIFQSK